MWGERGVGRSIHLIPPFSSCSLSCPLFFASSLLLRFFLAALVEQFCVVCVCLHSRQASGLTPAYTQTQTHTHRPIIFAVCVQPIAFFSFSIRPLCTQQKKTKKNNNNNKNPTQAREKASFADFHFSSVCCILILIFIFKNTKISNHIYCKKSNTTPPSMFPCRCLTCASTGLLFENTRRGGKAGGKKIIMGR